MLIVILNVLLASLVVIAVIGLLAFAILRSRAEAQKQPVRVGQDEPPLTPLAPLRTAPAAPGPIRPGGGGDTRDQKPVAA